MSGSGIFWKRSLDVTGELQVRIAELGAGGDEHPGRLTPELEADQSAGEMAGDDRPADHIRRLPERLPEGLDPALVAEHGRWEHAGKHYFDGEVEPCINGRTIETGAYFGVDVTAMSLGQSITSWRWICLPVFGSMAVATSTI